jgi:hypothetical protein
MSDVISQSVLCLNCGLETEELSSISDNAEDLFFLRVFTPTPVSKIDLS